MLFGLQNLNTTKGQQNPIETARASLRTLSERGVRIPNEVAAPIIRAQKVGDLKNADPELERSFWSAYGTLNSRIKPREDAKTYYRHFFYVILASLLLLQLYHSASITVQARLIDTGKALQALDSPAGASAEVIAKAAAKRSDLEKEQGAYLHLTRYLMAGPAVLAKLVSFGTATPIGLREDAVARVELELATSFVGGFLLPVLYGMLGAIAFVLRRLSDDWAGREVSRDLRNRYSLRVPIGALSGLAAGWLLQPTAATVVSSLSPFALAFVAGYSAELVFAAMDRIVGAFTSKAAPEDGRNADAPPARAEDAVLEEPDPAEPASTPAVDNFGAPLTTAPSSRAQANLDV
ncbi:hypothetical protein [Bradyrhizobium ganzhouense]|uniref:hypothetical protein n=1 Tax=Bradyrhizobium ganzhouense TaxID=1179767 RepID=UPI003CEC6A36